jgi:hypothetical protein
VLLESAEVGIDGLDDVKRRVSVDRDVGREALDDPSLVCEGWRRGDDRQKCRGDRDDEEARLRDR